MKILTISNLYPPYQLGGYEMGCFNVVGGLKERGHNVDVLTSPSHCPGDFVEPGVERSLQLRLFRPDAGIPHQLKMMEQLEACAVNYSNICRLLDKLKSFSPDCVYCFNLLGLGGLGLLDAMNTLHIPWALHLMDRLPVSLEESIPESIQSVFNAVDGELYSSGTIISMSRHLLKEISTITGWKFSRQPSIIPGWVKSEKMFHSRVYCQDGFVQFVNAGAVRDFKGIDLIIEAASNLLNNGIRNFSIDVYGEGDIEKYNDLIDMNGVGAHVRLRGFRSQKELFDIYQKADVFLFPTWEREPFGFAPVEAAAQGCVPIITKNCGVSERLVHSVHCLKIDRNTSALTKIMQQICEGKVLLPEIGRNGQRLTREDLSFSSCIAQIEQSLERTIVSTVKTPRTPGWRSYNLALLKEGLSRRIWYQKQW